MHKMLELMNEISSVVTLFNNDKTEMLIPENGKKEMLLLCN